MLSLSIPDTSLYYPGYYTYSTYDEQMDNVVCEGSEEKLIDCEHYIGISSSNTAVGMRCEQCKFCLQNEKIDVLCTLQLLTPITV